MKTNVIDIFIIQLFSEHFGVDKAKVIPTAHLVDDLGADSLDCVELIIEAESEFDIEISDKEMETWITVQSAIDSIKQKIKDAEILEDG